LRKAGIRESGVEITGSKVLRWRDEIGSTAPALTNDMHKQLSDIQRTRPAIDSLDAARRRVRQLIEGIKRAGF
jgi:hypothetical protein